MSPRVAWLCHTICVDCGKRFSGEVSAGDDPAPVIVAALAAAEAFAGQSGLGQADTRRLLIIVEELVANAVRHGSGGRDLSFVLGLAPAARGVAVTLEDSGMAFDPTAPREFSGPHPTSGGGVGLALVQEWSDELSYARENGRNRIALVLPCDR
jgi:serine/threonine-protein kinase RsbW